MMVRTAAMIGSSCEGRFFSSRTDEKKSGDCGTFEKETSLLLPLLQQYRDDIFKRGTRGSVVAKALW
jgi:hypothetical protein